MQQFYNTATMKSWERIYRAHFINSLSGFKSVSLIATVNENGYPNLAIFSNIVHIGADPAMVGFVNRPREAAPHTLANIESTGVYTINLISSSIIQQAHQTSAKYAKDESEFKAVGLEEEYHEWFKIPFVKESPVKYAMELQEVIPIRQNNTFFVTGTVTGVLADDTILEPDGFLSLEKAGIITSLGIDGYYAADRVNRLSYAKPGSKPRIID